MSLPEPILHHGSVQVVWERVRTTRALNYATPGEDHWIPEGSEGWAFKGRYGWTLTLNNPTGFWSPLNRFSASDDALELTGETIYQRYNLPDSAYETEGTNA